MTQSFILMALGIGIGVDRVAYRLAMQSALGADFVTSCKGSMTATQVRCVLNPGPGHRGGYPRQDPAAGVTLFELWVDPPALWEGAAEQN
jgi:hypothetical protein